MRHAKTFLLGALLVVLLVAPMAHADIDLDMDDMDDDDSVRGALAVCNRDALNRESEGDLRQCALEARSTGCAASCKKVVDLVGRSCVDEVVRMGAGNGSDDIAEAAALRALFASC